ncbi:hypothetical protein [Duganella callida]|uniref:Beta-glucuronidase C-terminal domain-containing protein n=1 Tax=Duganella callida TaxID=2561932 RepID=A0A4Y9SU60_9BURK|nr:hypothetical protein [Duganella callida]TFW30161.1 hypothetical protein E4L98_02575 [Duganella callida]
MLKRRSFIRSLFAAAALPSIARAAVPARIVIPAKATGAVIPPTLISLSYETDNLVDPRFFNAANTGLVRQFRRLNPDGILRLGGNTSDLARLAGFQGTLPVLHPLYRDKERVQPYYDVTPEALDALAGFLDATGWKVIFGLNMRADNADMVAQFAAIVRAKLGSRLLSLQIGNEANNYHRAYDQFHAAWERLGRRINRGDLSGPDSGANTDWVQRFSRDVPDAVLLSRHYYRDAADKGSLDDILRHDHDFDRDIALLARAGRSHAHGFWLTEVNSYYRGGLDGVSNAFASALWGLDFALSAACHGATGLCFQGGPRRSIESSLEGHKTGGANAANADIVARIDAVTSNYSPIGGDLDTGFAARPLYYGLVMARQLAGHRFYVLENADALPDVRVYATAAPDGSVRIVAINTSQHTARTPGFSGLKAGRAVQAAPLRAPSLTARTALTFGSDSGTLEPGAEWQLRYTSVAPVSASGALDVALPAGSAVLLHVQA